MARARLRSAFQYPTDEDDDLPPHMDEEGTLVCSIPPHGRKLTFSWRYRTRSSYRCSTRHRQLYNWTLLIHLLPYFRPPRNPLATTNLLETLSSQCPRTVILSHDHLHRQIYPCTTQKWPRWRGLCYGAGGTSAKCGPNWPFPAYLKCGTGSCGRVGRICWEHETWVAGSKGDYVGRVGRVFAIRYVSQSRGFAQVEAWAYIRYFSGLYFVCYCTICHDAIRSSGVGKDEVQIQGRLNLESPTGAKISYAKLATGKTSYLVENRNLFIISTPKIIS